MKLKKKHFVHVSRFWFFIICIFTRVICNLIWAQFVILILLFSRVQLFETPWAVARQAPPSMGFSRQEYRSGLPFPPPGALPDPGIRSMAPALAGRFLTTEPPGKPKVLILNPIV